MKKNLCLALLLIAALSTTMNAQRRERSEYDPMEKPNIVKINLTSLFYKNISLQYERILGEKISVALGLRFMPKGSLVFTNTIDQLASADSTSLSDWKASSYAITPEFRFYPKHAGKGFYIAPYIRYRNISLDLPVDYRDDNNAQQHVSVTGNLSSLIGGLMLGSQFNLGKMVTLDWYIFGLQYGISNGKLDIATSKPLSANDQADIRSSLADLKSASSSFNDINYVVTSNGGSISGKFGALGFRGFGLNLGFKF